RSNLSSVHCLLHSSPKPPEPLELGDENPLGVLFDVFVMMKQVRVTVPATTANLGPGFDCLGLALGLYNEVTFTTVTTPDVTITVSGEGAGIIPGDASNLVVRAARTLFQHL